MSFNLHNFSVLADNTVQPEEGNERIESLTANLPIIPPPNKSKCEKVAEVIFSPQTVSGVTAFSSVVGCIMVFTLFISVACIYSDISKLMVEGKNTLSDLNIILPEVSKTMSMLQHLCNTPNFKKYCFPE